MVMSLGNRFFYNYAGWKIIEPFVSRLDDEFRAIQLKFRRALYGTSTETPRAEICVDTLNDQFPNAIGHMYVSEFYDRKKNVEVWVKNSANLDWKRYL